MGRPFQELQRIFRELKRRNVYKVAATYAVVGFIVIQIADLTFVRLGLPSWTVTFVIALVALGFPRGRRTLEIHDPRGPVARGGLPDDDGPPPFRQTGRKETWPR